MGILAVQDDILFGTATVMDSIDARERRRGRRTTDATDGIFAIDLKTGKHLWEYQGQSISHRTIAIGPDRVFFIDSTITSEQRAEILRQDKSALEIADRQGARNRRRPAEKGRSASSRRD